MCTFFSQVKEMCLLMSVMILFFYNGAGLIIMMLAHRPRREKLLNTFFTFLCTFNTR